MKDLLLFDVDGVLTEPRKKILSIMKQTLEEAKKKYVLGFVGGSDIKKYEEQLGDSLKLFTYWFPENGLVAYKNGKKISETSIIEQLGETFYEEFVNYTLCLLSKTFVPKKRGTFIELRNGLINVSPVGRDCSNVERQEFEVYDKKFGVRQKMIKKLSKRFNDLKFSVGGMISFDVFPVGWDKTFCLNHLKDLFGKTYFFGDKTSKGGNDYELFIDPRVLGVTVKSYHDTIKMVNELIMEEKNE